MANGKTKKARSEAAKAAWKTRRENLKKAETICPHCKREYDKVLECINCGIELDKDDDIILDDDSRPFCCIECAAVNYNMQRTVLDDELYQDLLNDYGEVIKPQGVKA